MTLSEFQDANVSRVTDQLLVGGDLDLFDADRARRQHAELVAAGVRLVVDCRIEWSDEKVWAGTSAHYVHAPIDDAGQRVPSSWFDEHVDRVLIAMKDPDAQVLTHCHMGVNRGPSLGFAVLLALGHEPDAALALLQEARPIVYAYYAEDALEWWIGRSGMTRAEAADAREKLALRRERHRVDVHHVIADIHSAERDARSAFWDG